MVETPTPNIIEKMRVAVETFIQERHRVKSSKEMLVPFNRLEQYVGFKSTIEVGDELDNILQFFCLESGQEVEFLVTNVQAEGSIHDHSMCIEIYPKVQGIIVFTIEITRHKGFQSDLNQPFTILFHAGRDEGATYPNRETFNRKSGAQNTKVRFCEKLLFKKILEEIDKTETTTIWRKEKRDLP